MEVEAILRRVEIFGGLSGRQIARLAKLVTRREFPEGTRILQRGDTGTALYILTRGRVTVTLPSEETDEERSVAELGPGAVFGEMALIDEGPRSANVTATEPSECLMLTRWDFSAEVRRSPDILGALLPVLCARLRRLQEHLLRYEATMIAD
jgi:CRP-like cAMP-binding protein